MVERIEAILLSLKEELDYYKNLDNGFDYSFEDYVQGRVAQLTDDILKLEKVLK